MSTVARPRLGARQVLELSRQLLRFASSGPPRVEFLQQASEMLINFFACDAVAIWMYGQTLSYRWETQGDGRSFHYQPCHSQAAPPTPMPDCVDVLCDLIRRGQAVVHSGRAPLGGYWTACAEQDIPATVASAGLACDAAACRQFRSWAIAPFEVDAANHGLLHIRYRDAGRLNAAVAVVIDRIAQTVGMAIADRRAQYEVRERAKELQCLYGVAQVAERADLALPDKLERIVALLPAAYQYPEMAAARLSLDDHAYGTPGFGASELRQTAEVRVGGRARGRIEVVYLTHRPEFAEGAFLPEEQSLIERVAAEVGRMIEHLEITAQQQRLENQLRHADRLATIGQLAAGVAHELNEPLGAILGFAQLLRKTPGLPAGVVPDLDQIVAASLHGREIIRKLMTFARQAPAQKARVSLNAIVLDGLNLLAPRCAKAGIGVQQRLASDLPPVDADPAQLQQVLVNLVVNALQAMPEGGALTIETGQDAGQVHLSVSDTGTGMSPEVQRQIFTPFFTTKGVGEGTGLGLAVVHGIVTSHRGTIEVRSAVGQGTRFVVRLPAAPPEEGP